MPAKLRYLLLQTRNRDDPMRAHEIRCFARALGCDAARIDVFDLLKGCPTPGDLAREDVVLLGGSGDYSVSQGGPWLEGALDAMRELHDMGKPTFASCWGFQAMARALGGSVVKDLDRAEVGTHEVHLTDAGRGDPIFGPLAADGVSFPAQLGHQDVVDDIPADAVLAAFSQRARQAFFFPGKPIYCTQFHPELTVETLLDRLRQYPTYIERITGLGYDEFVATHTRPSPGTDVLLRRYVEHVFGGRD